MPFRTSTHHRRRAAIAGAFALAALTACGNEDGGSSASARSTSPDAATSRSNGATSATENAVVIESCGVGYEFTSPPERVLLGWPQSAETLLALGVADRVVGYFSGSLSKLPDDAPDIPEVSPDFSPSREAFARAAPDLVIVNDITSVDGSNGGVNLTDLEAAGTNVFVLGDYCGFDAPAPTNVDVALQDLRDLGAIFGVEAGADELVAEMETALEGVDVGDGRATAFVQVFDGKLYALSGSNYAAILGALDLQNVFADLDGNFSEISAEAVLALQPDVVIVVYSDASTDATTATSEIGDILANSPAVASGDVYAITDSEVSAGGTTIIDVIERLATNLES